MAKPQPNLKHLFGARGSRLAEVYRTHLGKAILGTPQEQQKAQAILRAAAEKTASELRADSQKWIGSDFLKVSVAAGQKRAAFDIGIKFGGVNTQLLNRMAYEASRNLIVASESTRPFLERTIRRSQAYAAERVTGATADPIFNPATLSNADFERAFNASITQGAIETEHGRTIAKRILRDTGLEKGDKVLLMNGQQWSAGDYAEILSMTRKAEAENLAYADSLQQNGYQFIETSQHAGVTPGDICELLQGKVWALTENTLGIPVLPPEYGTPPWHPRCGHTFAVWIPELNGGNKAIQEWAKKHEAISEQLEKWRSDTTGTLRTMQPTKK